jgi:hypothetical protein
MKNLDLEYKDILKSYESALSQAQRNLQTIQDTINREVFIGNSKIPA